MPSWLLLQICIISVALVIDVLGEPPARVHPVVWMGRIIAATELRLYNGTTRAQRLNGAAVAIIVIACFTVPVALFQFLGYRIANNNSLFLLLYVALNAYLLKSSFTIFTLRKEALSVTELAYKDIDTARFQLRALVSRERTGLDRKGIMSSVCESIAESTIDSIVSPLLFFAFFGIAGAICYRAVNTLDSMLGYRDHRENVGLASARLDDIFNYLPTRFAVAPIVAGFYIMSGKAACVNALTVLKRDRNKKRAVNSGIPIALFAGGLGVTLIKPSAYKIGDGKGDITQTVVRRALNVMLFTSICTVALTAVILVTRVLT